MLTNSKAVGCGVIFQFFWKHSVKTKVTALPLICQPLESNVM